MKKLITTALFAAVVAAPALAADEKYTLVKDTVGNCSAVALAPHYPGMNIVSTTSYSSIESAKKALDDLKGCSGLVR